MKVDFEPLRFKWDTNGLDQASHYRQDKLSLYARWAGTTPISGCIPGFKHWFKKSVHQDVTIITQFFFLFYFFVDNLLCSLTFLAFSITSNELLGGLAYIADCDTRVFTADCFIYQDNAFPV